MPGTGQVLKYCYFSPARSITPSCVLNRNELRPQPTRERGKIRARLLSLSHPSVPPDPQKEGSGRTPFQDWGGWERHREVMQNWGGGSRGSSNTLCSGSGPRRGLSSKWVTRALTLCGPGPRWSGPRSSQQRVGRQGHWGKLELRGKQAIESGRPRPGSVHLLCHPLPTPALPAEEGEVRRLGQVPKGHQSRLAVSQVCSGEPGVLRGWFFPQNHPRPSSPPHSFLLSSSLILNVASSGNPSVTTLPSPPMSCLQAFRSPRPLLSTQHISPEFTFIPPGQSQLWPCSAGSPRFPTRGSRRRRQEQPTNPLLSNLTPRASHLCL